MKSRSCHKAHNKIPFPLGTIFFFGEGEQFFELTNFWIHNPPLQWNDEPFKSVEHIYQMQKYYYQGCSPESAAYGIQIKDANTPFIAKILSRMWVSGKNEWRKNASVVIEEAQAQGVIARPDWLMVNMGIMIEAVRLKFAQDEHCREVLLSTGDVLLVENSPTDGWWGIGKNKKGLNKFGIILMQIREEIRREEENRKRNGDIEVGFKKQS